MGYMSRDGVAVGDDWGDVYTIPEGLETFSAKATTNDAEVQFSKYHAGQVYEFGDAMTVPTGGWTGIDQGTLAEYVHFRFRRATAGQAATVDFRAFPVPGGKIRSQGRY